MSEQQPDSSATTPDSGQASEAQPASGATDQTSGAAPDSSAASSGATSTAASGAESTPAGVSQYNVDTPASGHQSAPPQETATSSTAASAAAADGTSKAHQSSPGPSTATSRAQSTTSHRSATSESRHSSSKRADSAGTSKGSSSRPRKLGQLKIENARIGILGAGKIADALVQGLINYGKIDPKKIHIAAPSSKGLERFKSLGCRVTKRNYDIFGRYDCDIVFLAFHGYVIKHCYKLGGARPHPLTTNYIPHQRHPVYILSLVSGVSLSQIKACLLNPESHTRYVLEIHRIMMNTAVGHGLGICAIDCEPDSKKLSAPLRQLLSSIAQLENVPASQMDAACAIGGSGLAFAYYFINALADGAFKMGLSRQQAIRFASKTAQCAAQTMLESGKHPAELRDNVSSPSGAAIYGIHVLEKNDVASGVTAAVEAAHKRANDLATQDVA